MTRFWRWIEIELNSILSEFEEGDAEEKKKKGKESFEKESRPLAGRR